MEIKQLVESGVLERAIDVLDELGIALRDCPQANLPREARNSQSSAYEEALKQLRCLKWGKEFPEDASLRENVEALLNELCAELS